MLITCTGWTWDYIDQHVTLPMVRALNASWSLLPPPALALRRIGQALGVKAPAGPPQRAATAAEAMRDAQAGGLPVMLGRPDDPMLAFLDLPDAPPNTRS